MERPEIARSTSIHFEHYFRYVGEKMTGPPSHGGSVAVVSFVQGTALNFVPPLGSPQLLHTPDIVYRGRRTSFYSFATPRETKGFGGRPGIVSRERSAARRYTSQMSNSKKSRRESCWSYHVVRTCARRGRGSFRPPMPIS